MFDYYLDEPEKCVLCNQEIMIACGLCFVALCENHEDTSCQQHNALLYSVVQAESNSCGKCKL